MTRNLKAPSSPEKRRVTRHLRSKEEVKIDESLFNFEEDSRLVNPDQTILIVDHIQDAQLFPMDFELNREKIQLSTHMVEVKDDEDLIANGKRGRTLRKSTIKKVSHVDPLNEDLYSVYHRRMAKEEKRMVNLDREAVYSEADRMKGQLEALKQNDWAKSLPNITYIRDPRDLDEMTQKREWTLTTLETVLAKFDDWKRREDRIHGRTRQASTPQNHELNDLKLYTQLNKADYVGDSDTDEEEEGLSVEDIKHRRVKREALRFGPVIKIKFGNNMVVAEPFKHPRVEQL